MSLYMQGLILVIHFPSLQGDDELFRSDEHRVGAVHGDGDTAGWVSKREVGGDVRDGVEGHAHCG